MHASEIIQKLAVFTFASPIPSWSRRHSQKKRLFVRRLDSAVELGGGLSVGNVLKGKARLMLERGDGRRAVAATDSARKQAGIDSSGGQIADVRIAVR